MDGLVEVANGSSRRSVLKKRTCKITAEFPDIRTLADSNCTYKITLSEIIHSCKPESNSKTRHPSISDL
jgi:hypothetical protein